MENSDFDSLDESDDLFQATLNIITAGFKRSGYKRKRVVVKQRAMGDSKRSKRVPLELELSRNSEVPKCPPKKRSSATKSKTLDLGSDSVERVKGPCKVCQKMTTQICICQLVFYCCKKHEEQDYASHKSKCFSFTVPMKGSLGSFVSQSRTHSQGTAAHIKGVIPLEDRYIVARRRVEPGTVLFKESPILIAPNYLIPRWDAKDKKKIESFCLGCMEDFKGSLDESGRNIVFSMCSSCKLPLCKNCYREKENGKHSQYECKAIKEASKLGDVLNLKNLCPYQNEDLIKDLTVLRAILLQKTNVSHWTAFINLKFNVRFTQSLRTTPDVVKKWVKTKTPISENYMKGLNENFFRLEDVKRIIALFSSTSTKNGRTRILYDFVSWMPQSCAPKASIYITEDKNHEITVKAVDEIDAGKEISINNISDYDGGSLISALKLYSKTGMICGCEGCKFNLYDTSVGVYCNSENCKGFMSPKAFRIEPGGSSFPDIYSPSYVWQCNMCKKPKKFISIQKHVDDTLKEVKKDISDFAKRKCEKSDSVLRENVEKKLHGNHWLKMKLDKLILASLDTQIGFGNEMLQSAVSKTRSKNFLYSLEKKKSIYYDHPGRQGFLTKISEMRGPFSETVGIYKFDAGYVLFIDFLERFKADCIKDWKAERIDSKSMNSLSYMNELQRIISGLEDAHTCLSSSTLSKHRNYGQIAQQSFEVYAKVFEKILSKPSSPKNTYLQDLLASYTLNDPTFPRSVFNLTQQQPEKGLLFDIFDDTQEIALKFDDLDIDSCEDESKESFSDDSSDSYRTNYNYDYDSSGSEYENSRYRSSYRSYRSQFNFDLPPGFERGEPCHIM